MRGGDDAVYLLDANLMTARQIADSFDEFLEREVAQNARHTFALQCIEKFGQVDAGTNLVLAPSYLLGGLEEVANVVPVESFTAMIYGGDIYTALLTVGDEVAVTGVVPWRDDAGRQRLRVVFGDH